MKKALITLSVFVCCTPLLSIAHPGHGETDGYTITHYFKEPVHIVIAIAALVTFAAAARYIKKSKQRS